MAFNHINNLIYNNEIGNWLKNTLNRNLSKLMTNQGIIIMNQILNFQQKI